MKKPAGEQEGSFAERCVLARACIARGENEGEVLKRYGLSALDYTLDLARRSATDLVNPAKYSDPEAVREHLSRAMEPGASVHRARPGKQRPR